MKSFCLLLISIISFTLQVRSQSNDLSAKEIIRQAASKASSEKKNVFVIFHASWCVWCRNMDTVLSRPAVKPLFDRSYVTTHIVVMESPGKKQLETKGGQEFLNEHVPGQTGIPVWAIFDTNGKLLIDSRIRTEASDVPGQNTGCPATKEEIEYFIQALKRTSTLSDDELKQIANAFGKLRNIEF